MAEMVTDLLQPGADGGLGQGVVQLKRETAGGVDPDQPWVPVEPTAAFYPLDAAVRRVNQKYIDGTLIVATDNQVTFAVPAIVPAMSDTLIIDGRELAMKDLRPIPPAGTVVAYIAFVAG
ncbi:hypothetical protein HKB47_22640 [Mesorhizobium japonicum]|uniref:Uncharacterized protein n=3 Tax=Phyllobacteriaceae TaxID=69277 RepID=A0A1A5IA56_RHILI|nr:hypothetical protein [Mesorhizobium japonicum]OBP71008.1 hypothetical protein BAE41_17725 [Mesorhizobium loti]QGX81390.1 hypothetical protein EB234_22955 [Mesorhizobium japonicum R7A]MBE1709665.1 hypothetical protein [Mesorhizobium japonicum]MBE1714334.1 hypothetical protein [Mesorhizobium japonicum]MUT25315.1 hypothetical protein [Mesorhizobium japonicum]